MKKLTPDTKAAGAMGLPSKPGLEARAGSKPLRDGSCYLQTGPIHTHMEAQRGGRWDAGGLGHPQVQNCPYVKQTGLQRTIGCVKEVNVWHHLSEGRILK